MKINKLLLSIICLFPSIGYAVDLNYSLLETEQSNPLTANLTEELNNNLLIGLETLCKVDTSIYDPLNKFIEHDYLHLTKLISGIIGDTGRIFIIGSGSSGRIAIKLGSEHFLGDRVIGKIAGNLSAFMRAKEGYEDSESEGALCLKEANLTKNDTVILLSASGTANFNFGAAKYALGQQAKVIYFINVRKISHKLETLSEQELTTVQVISGAEAITGSTRLNAANCDYIAIGLVLEAVASYLKWHLLMSEKNLDGMLLDQARSHIKDLKKIDDYIKNNLKSYADIVEQMAQTLNKRHYITYLAIDSMAEVLTDITELSPTFSLPRVRSTKEANKPIEPIKAYRLKAQTNLEAWENICKCKLTEKDKKDIMEWRIGGIDGAEAFYERPISMDDLFLIITKGTEPQENIDYVNMLAADLSVKTKIIRLHFNPNVSSKIASIVGLKKVLNLISNATMIKIGKTYSNLMVDVSASNKKLRDRTVRIIQAVLTGLGKAPGYNELMQTIDDIEKKRSMSTQAIPSTAKIAVIMHLKSVDIDKAIKILSQHNDSLQNVISSIAPPKTIK